MGPCVCVCARLSEQGGGSRGQKTAAKMLAATKSNEAVTSGIAPLDEQLRVNKLSMVGPLASNIQNVRTLNTQSLQSEFDANSAAYSSLANTGISNLIEYGQYKALQKQRKEGQQPINITLTGK